MEKIIKKRVNSKSKGNGFELTIAKELSKVFTPLVFKRTQMSGAITGGFNARNNHHYSKEMLTAFIGDIFPSNEADVDFKFRFSLECKFYKDADSFSSLFKNPKILDWFEQAKTDAAKIPDKHPLLIFKFNHTQIFIGFNIDPPKTAKRILTLEDIQICLLEEALLDLNWWKVVTNESNKEIQGAHDSVTPNNT